WGITLYRRVNEFHRPESFDRNGWDGRLGKRAVIKAPRAAPGPVEGGADVQRRVAGKRAALRRDGTATVDHQADAIPFKPIANNEYAARSGMILAFVAGANRVADILRVHGADGADAEVDRALDHVAHHAHLPAAPQV